MDQIFEILTEESLEMHGLYEERTLRGAPNEYGNAPWNCRLVYRFAGSNGKLWPMYCYGAGLTPREAILSAVADARHLRSTPRAASKAAATELSLEELGL